MDTQTQYSSGKDVSVSDSLREFQLEKLTTAEKSDKEFGLKLSKKIWGYVISGTTGYYYNRNARFRKNRDYANGRIDVQAMFQDRFQMNSKENHIRLNWRTLQIVNRIVSGLVGRWMQRNETITVKAVDDLSQKDKKYEYDQLEFIVSNRKMLSELEGASGVSLTPKDKDIPTDKDELALWQAQFQRIPEEILYEMGCNDVLQSNGLDDVIKEKLLDDSAVVGLVGTYTYMDKQGVIHTEWCKPENIIYSWSEFPDFRDTTWRGMADSIKISELRKMYGQEFNPDNPNALTEEQLFEIALTAKEVQYYSNIVWTSIWVTNYWLRPYDEWNVRCLKFEVKTIDNDKYTVTNTKATGTTYTQKGEPKTASGKKKEKPSDNQQVISDDNWNIYRSVYLPDNDLLLEWGLKENMIRPQDPKEIGNAEFSYSFYMYQNFEMRNLAVPEKIEAAVDGMILALLKIQQVMARLVPSGWAIDETVLQNTDYGLGDAGNKAVDHTQVYFQTGLLYYHGLDTEGNRVPPPITELKNAGFSAQMQGLIANYQFWYSTLKDELGEDPNLISATATPRVTSDNVQVSQQLSDYATDYMYRAYTEVMKQTARKVSCLLKDSVMYGSKAYSQITKEDIDKRIFTTDIRFLPNAQDIAMFESIMNQAIQGHPEILQFLDPFQLIRVAKEDVKLAELLFRRAQKKMTEWQQQTAAQNQQMNAQVQQQSLQMKAQFDMQQMQTEMQMKGDLADRESKNKILELLITGFTNIMTKGIDVQPEWKPLETEVINNTLIPLFAQNMQNVGALGSAIQESQQKMLAQQQGQEEQQQQMMQQQGQPQQNQQPQQVAQPPQAA